MNISWECTSGLLRGMNSAGMLKSTRDRLERQENTQKQVDFYEQQKANLKNVKCGSVEEIAEKLNMLHSYDDQIAAAKAAYNSEQMWHILDESTERGEKIAEAVEKSKPKTPEERQEELVEEALGIEDAGGLLDELTEEIEKMTEELTEEITEELTGELTEAVGEVSGELAEAAGEVSGEVPELTGEMAGEISGASMELTEETLEKWKQSYVPFDVRL